MVLDGAKISTYDFNEAIQELRERNNGKDTREQQIRSNPERLGERNDNQEYRQGHWS